MRTGETGGKIDDEKRRHKIKFQEKITEFQFEVAIATKILNNAKV